MKHTLLATLLALAACATAPAQAQSCLPVATHDRAALDTLKAASWDVPDDAARNGLALSLAACVADPDPAIRDGIAFEAYAHWLRSRALTPETMRALVQNLRARLHAPQGEGFEQPFAALVLSELARADRIESYLSQDEFDALAASAQSHFIGVSDYRGFDEREGWRHGVAHGADLLLQLGLNPRLGAGEQYRLTELIGGQIAPRGHFYIYGEPERLARPIIFIAQRGDMSEEQWTSFFVRLVPSESENLFASQEGLARRHNIKAFLYAVYVNARISESTADDVLLPGVEAAIRAIP